MMDNVLNIAIKGHLTNSNCFYYYFTTEPLDSSLLVHGGILVLLVTQMKMGKERFRHVNWWQRLSI